MNIEQLNKLARTDFSNFIQSENNVKYKIVIPFLQSFNHVDLDLEHAAQGSRIDINIGNRIIVETKALGINIDMHVQQLSNYSGKELPVLAILTNGRQFRIYSPQWRKQLSFSEKVIYDFDISDLNDLELINRLEKILDFSNYESEDYIDNLEEREREIINAKKEIDEVKKVKSEQAIEVNSEINKLKEQILEITQRIQLQEKIVADINADKIPEIEDKIGKYYLPANKSKPVIFSRQTLQVVPQASNIIGARYTLELPRFGVKASGRLLDNGCFEVLENSTINKKVGTSLSESVVAKRKEYEDDGTIENYRFTKPVKFKSQNEAALFICGSSVNKDKWKPDN